MRGIFVALLLSCVTVCGFAGECNPACAEGCTEAKASAWVTPKDPNGQHGTLWLNPGDSYEHSTGLVRDARGNHYHPIRPGEQPAQYAVGGHMAYRPSPNYRPVVPYYPYPVNPVPQSWPSYPQYNQPQYPPSPYYIPNYPQRPQVPYYSPQPVSPSPYYQPAPCPTCPNRRPYGAIDPLSEKKTGMQECGRCGKAILGSDMNLDTGVCRWCEGNR
ncbi:hypothetical protein LOC67_23490 [Stieleria sp. JC731]|uniref:hypothetical protein n=1 Tax=Pirellulaceae TaxID=2691357 RepID=UPI001E500B99|nr:hypothetical protein [Stieleria sp. JC731]MCC9603524.1 hypothetical protein [Stieleria sp. JC731]